MFGLGASEIIVIVFIGVIVLGPKKIPELARTCGKVFKEFKNAKESFVNEVNSEETEVLNESNNTSHEIPSVYNEEETKQ